MLIIVNIWTLSRFTVFYTFNQRESLSISPGRHPTSRKNNDILHNLLFQMFPETVTSCDYIVTSDYQLFRMAGCDCGDDGSAETMMHPPSSSHHPAGLDAGNYKDLIWNYWRKRLSLKSLLTVAITIVATGQILVANPGQLPQTSHVPMSLHTTWTEFSMPMSRILAVLAHTTWYWDEFSLL